MPRSGHSEHPAGVRHQFGMLSAFSVERCPPSRWNTVRHQHGIVSAIAWNTQLSELGQNLERAAASGELFNKVNPARILWLAPALMPERCKVLFQALKQRDPSLDRFALAMTEDGFDSVNGRIYALDKEIDRLEAYIAVDILKQHASDRLKDQSLEYPVRAAWRAIVEEKKLYGNDGSLVQR